MYRKKKKIFEEILKEYLKNNIKEYLIVIILFIIGILSGVFFLNNYVENNENDIIDYIETYINDIKQNDGISIDMIAEIKDDVLLTVIMWFAGTTIIGIPIVLGIIVWRGFCIGYTISGITYTLGIQKGLNFALSTMLLQNIIFIPVILTLGVSGIKLYKTIMRDKRKENIKVQMIKHTMCSIFMLILLIFSGIIKTQISAVLLKKIVKYL